MTNPSRNNLNRRDAVKTGLAAAIALNTAPAVRPETRKKPNILFIMDDQHRGDCLGVDGHPCVKTPNLDWLAGEGVHFRSAYSTTPTCTPARAALLTGLSPWNHGMLGYSKIPQQYPNEKPRMLNEVGYFTACIGKNHFDPQRNGHGYQQVILDESGRAFSPEFRSDYRAWFYSEAPNYDPDVTGIGFNDYRARPFALPERLHPTHWTGMTAVNFLNTYERDEPFYLKVSFARPHSPYDPPQRFFDLYNDADIPKRSVGKWADRYAKGEPDNFNSWHGDFGEGQARSSRQGYYGAITFIDEQIGLILQTLQKRGWDENTLILFTSDHGDMMGDHHLWRKSYAYEGSARIPMILRPPKNMTDAKPGQILDNPVEIRDILPTFLDAASAPGTETMDGSSLLDLARGSSEGWRDYIDLEHDICYDKRNHWNALTDGRIKYIFHAIDGEEQLFDLKDDPGEETDLAPESSHQSTLGEWRSRMIEHLSIRGETFVKNGKLALRPESTLRSPNYPAG